MKAAQFYKIYFSIQDYLMILFGTYWIQCIYPVE